MTKPDGTLEFSTGGARTISAAGDGNVPNEPSRLARKISEGDAALLQ